MRQRWDQAVNQGLFRHKIDDEVQYRRIPGRFDMVIQINPKRLNKRTRPAPFQSLKDPFDPDAFNFLKVRPNEVLK